MNRRGRGLVQAVLLSVRYQCSELAGDEIRWPVASLPDLLDGLIVFVLAHGISSRMRAKCGASIDSSPKVKTSLPFPMR
jgi:hypothetical protein